MEYTDYTSTTTTIRRLLIGAIALGVVGAIAVGIVLVAQGAASEIIGTTFQFQVVP